MVSGNKAIPDAEKLDGSTDLNCLAKKYLKRNNS